MAESLKILKDLKFVNLKGIRFRIIDARDQVVGVLATQITQLLQGKDKPIYNKHFDRGDVVIVVNCAHVVLSLDKWEKKVYRYFTGFGKIKAEMTAQTMWQRDPTRILLWAVAGMLPKDQFKRHRVEYKLRLFPEADHPFTEFNLVPYIPTPRPFGPPALSWMLPRGLEPLNPHAYKNRISGTDPDTRARSDLSFDDMLTEEERKLVSAAASEQDGKVLESRQRRGLQLLIDSSPLKE